MNVAGMNHFTILAEDLEATRRFYRDVLGFVEGWRPPLDFPGIWFYVGDIPLLHVIGGRTRDELKAGVLDHMAFTATDINAAVRRLRAQDVRFEVIKQVGSGIWQIFFHDPNNAKIELDFAPDEALTERV